MKIAGSKILVTGGTGFIGSALVRGLLRAGARLSANPVTTAPKAP